MVLPTKRAIEAVEVLKTLNVRNKDLIIDELEVDVQDNVRNRLTTLAIELVLTLVIANVKKWDAFSRITTVSVSMTVPMFLTMALIMLTAEVLLTLKVLNRDLIIVEVDVEVQLNVRNKDFIRVTADVLVTDNAVRNCLIILTVLVDK